MAQKVTPHMLKRYEKKTRKIRRKLKDQNRKDIYNYIMKNCRIPIEDVGKDGKKHIVKRTTHLKDGKKVKRTITRRIIDCKDYTKNFINIRKNDDGTLALDQTQKVKIDGVSLPISEVIKIVTKYMEYIKKEQHQKQKHINDSNNQDQQQDNNDQNDTGNSDDSQNQNINEDPYSHPDNNLNPDNI